MKRKPRVLIDAFHLLNALTGIRTYTLQLCEELEKRDDLDFEVVVYPNWRVLNNTNLLRGNVGFFKKILNHFLFFAWKQIMLPFVILFTRADLIFVPDYLLPLVKFRAQGIAVFHDTFYWELKDNYNPIWRKYFLLSVKLGLNSRSMIFTDTKHSQKKIESVVTKEYPIDVVYLSPSGLSLGMDEQEVLKEFGSIKDKNYFLHVGVFDQRKNITVLVKAFSMLLKASPHENYHLVLVGSRAVTIFHDSMDEVKDLIRSEGLEDYVSLPGFVSNNALAVLYNNAFAYVFPSKEEGFGIPAIEAMRFHVPVIVSNQGALVEVTNGAALVFDMNDEQELFEKMIEISDQGLREQLIKKGNLRVDFFSQENFANQFSRSVKCHLERGR